MSGAGKDLLDCFPEAERPVADREVRGDLEPALCLCVGGRGLTCRRGWRTPPNALLVLIGATPEGKKETRRLPDGGARERAELA